ncbi:hypothetical protein ACJJID_06315 [Microbulbifer sp. CnH-101-G]|uniref:hypothetical protein n=1 Tax=Microbulbifer sp. CnH-101-G TaxID=3243393 RepID=UPI0040397820
MTRIIAPLRGQLKHLPARAIFGRAEFGWFSAIGGFPHEEIAMASEKIPLFGQCAGIPALLIKTELMSASQNENLKGASPAQQPTVKWVTIAKVRRAATRSA